MTIAFPCEKCGHRFEVDASLAGKKCKCKKCDHVFLIPVPRASTSSPSKTVKTFGEGETPAPAKPRPAATAASRSAAPAAKPARPAPAPTSVPDPYYDASDPYGIDDLPSPPRKAPAPQEDEEFLAPRMPKPVATKPKTQKKRADDDPADIPTWGYLIVIAVMVTLYISAFNSGNASLFLMTGRLQMLLTIVGFLGTLVVALMRVGPKGLLLFIPIANLFFIYGNYATLRPWVNIYLSTIIISAINGGFVGGTMATQDPAARERSLRLLASSGAAAGPVLPAGAGDAAPGTTPDLVVRPNPIVPDFRPQPQMPQAGSLPAPGNLSPQPFSDEPGAQPTTPDVRQRPDAPAGAVVLNVTGMADGPTRDAFNAKLDELVGTLGNQVRKRSSRRGDRATINIEPVDDVQSFADQITFANVVGVHGRTITVALIPGTGAAESVASGPDTDFVDQVLADLKSSNLQKRKQALGKLRGSPVDEARRVEVAGAVEPFLKDSDGWVRGDAAKALAVWGGKQNTPALTKALNDPDFGVRWAVLDTIAALKDPAAAEPVAALLEKERGKASTALKAMGSGAEDAVVKYLNHRDVFVRMEACKILQAIGTKKCVPALTALFRKVNGQGLDAMAAREAVQAIGPVENSPRKKSVIPATPKRR